MNEQELARAQECAETLIEREYDMYDLEYMDLEIKKMFPALVAEVRRLNLELDTTKGALEHAQSYWMQAIEQRDALNAENARLRESEEYQDIDRSMAAELERYAFVVEDETGMLSDAMLTPEKLEEILHTLKGQRDYAAETAEMHARIAERLMTALEPFANMSDAITKLEDKAISNGMTAYYLIALRNSDGKTEVLAPWHFRKAAEALKGGEG